METTSFSLLEMFKLGGIFMWPLLAFSIATISIGLERLVFLLYHNLKMDDISRKTSDFIAGHDYEGAVEYLTPLVKRRLGARVILAMIKRALPFHNKKAGQNITFSERPIERAAETEAMICIGSIEKSFNFLVALGSLSPLTGFLGTVSGMIGAFKSIAEATEVNAQIVANGIYEALITTVCGLVIAIFAMIFHSVFSHIVDKFAADIEKSSSDLIADISAEISGQQEMEHNGAA
ncbi:MAG: MotA/TolQ/ExbB proton channel family protein [Treponema sp.]|nr:MotA/TolQ/ExbB proton channel family protein [Treponema sp.]